MENQPNSELHRPPQQSEQQWMQRVLGRLSSTLERDTLVQKITHQLREELQADRVVLFYFYEQWKGQVISEALSSDDLSIVGSTGADECFNNEYAALYETGRVRAIADIAIEPIHDCHRDFLQSIQVRANLAVPILTAKRLWGLLIAHHCKTSHPWSLEEVAYLQDGAQTLATTPSIQDN